MKQKSSRIPVLSSFRFPIVWRLAARLVVLQLVMAVCIAALIAIVGGKRIHEFVKSVLYPSIQQQAVYVVEDLRNTTPNTKYIRMLARRLHLRVVVRYGNIELASDNALLGVLSSQDKIRPQTHKSSKALFRFPPPPDKKFWSDDESENSTQSRKKSDYFGHHKHAKNFTNTAPYLSSTSLPGLFRAVRVDEHAGLLYQEQNFHVLMLFSRKVFPFDRQDVWIIGLGSVLLLIVTILIILWLLAPLQGLRRAIANMQQGRFDKPLIVRRRDELGTLSTAFDTMRRQIVEQFEKREQLLVDISHELRSPLARMLVAVEMLGDSSIKRRLQHDIREQESLLGQLLDNARLGSAIDIQHKKTDIVSLANTVVNSYANDRIVLQVFDKDIRASVDPQLVERIFTNLIDNALKYADNDCTIDIHLHRRVKQPPHALKSLYSTKTTPHNIYIQIRVCDRGPGIALRDQHRVFDAFYRLDTSRTPQNPHTNMTGTKSTQVGYGLGLSICKRIAKAHGGDAYIDTAYTQGLCVVVDLLFDS